MDNRFDHIEDSLRKAFDNFELPVTDQDWAVISEGIEKRRRRAWYLRWPWLLLLTGLTTAVVLTFTANTGKQTETAPAVKESIRANPVPAEKPARENNVASSGNPDNIIPANGGFKTAGTATAETVKPAMPAPVAGSPEIPAAPASPVQAPAGPVAVATPVAAPVATPGSSEPVPVRTSAQEEARKLMSQLRPFGLRLLLAGFTEVIFREISGLKPARTPKPPKPPVTLGWYANSQLSAASLSTSDQRQSGTWNAQSANLPLIGNLNPVNLRFDAGWYMGLKSWKFSGGLGLEGNPAAASEDRTTTIKIATRFLPYFDSRGRLLYWLAVEWKDSVIRYRQTQRQVWTEIPLQAEKTLWKNNKLQVMAGLSLNPGMSLLNRSNTINPYTSQSGSYWQHTLGRSVDTTSAVISTGDQLSRTRLGNGLSLGAGGQTGSFGWSVTAQTRYYYTSIWKSQSMPWQQRQWSYGIQFRLDWKF